MRVRQTHHIVLVSAEDLLPKIGKLYAGGADLPATSVGNACASKGASDDLVAEAFACRETSALEMG